MTTTIDVPAHQMLVGDMQIKGSSYKRLVRCQTQTPPPIYPVLALFSSSSRNTTDRLVVARGMAQLTASLRSARLPKEFE